MMNKIRILKLANDLKGKNKEKAENKLVALLVLGIATTMSSAVKDK